jgi:hypothetical protein
VYLTPGLDFDAVCTAGVGDFDVVGRIGERLAAGLASHVVAYELRLDPGGSRLQ